MNLPSHPPHRPEGFPGQQIVVLPARTIEAIADHPLAGDLIPSAAGYFPRARGHLVRRQRGIDESILMLCSEGRGWIEIDSQRIGLAPEQAAWIPAGLAHSYGADSDQPWTLAWVHLRGAHVAAIQRWLGFDRKQVTASVPNAIELIASVDRVSTALRPPHHETDLLLAAAFTRQLLIDIKRLRDKLSDHHPDLAERVRATADWMRDHVDRPIRLAELAGRAQLSVSRYSEVFKQIHNCPPMAYCTSQRVRKACEILAATTLKVHEVAEQVGYDDPLYFSRVFKKVMGSSPRQYRRYIRS